MADLLVFNNFLRGREDGDRVGRALFGMSYIVHSLRLMQNTCADANVAAWEFY